GLGQGTLPVVAVVGAGDANALGGELAGEYFGLVTVVVIVAVGVGQEPLGVLVVVFVDDVRAKLGQLFPRIIKLAAIGERTGAGDEQHVRVLRLDRRGELHVSLGVARAPLL